MKVAINRKYGGFSISIKALEELYKMKSEILVITPIKKYFDSENTSQYEIDEHIRTCRLLKREGNIIDLKDDTDIFRSHPDLIKVVEKLGKDSWGHVCEIKIVEIPDKVDYEIQEYDGLEWIAEKHRTWY